MIIGKVASETIGKMLKDGYSISLNITALPDQEDGVESYYIIFFRSEFVEPGKYEPVGDIREFLEAYSGDGRGTVSEAIKYAADNARLAMDRGLTFRYEIPYV